MPPHSFPDLRFAGIKSGKEQSALPHIEFILKHHYKKIHKDHVSG